MSLNPSEMPGAAVSRRLLGQAETPPAPELNGHGENVSILKRSYRLGNEVDDFRWLLEELGAKGLSGIFLRGGDAVVVPAIGEEGYIPPARPEDCNGPATVRPVGKRGVVTRLALNYRVYRRYKNEDGTWEDREKFFPERIADHALDALDKTPNLRILRGVTHTPLVRADGSILSTPGYDGASGFLYSPTVVVPHVPPEPSIAERDAALTLLREMISEFSWAGEHDETNFLGLILTPLLRLLCPPPYKLGAIMAHQPGSGKSLLARIIRDTHGGVFRSEMPHDDAEMAKSLSSILMCTTAPVIQFDNVTGMLRSSRLAGLLTSAVYSDRILGKTQEQADMSNDRLWVITGNNLSLGSDLVRRTVWVTIDPRCPEPERRTDFKLNLPRYIAGHRGEILAALLTLVASWHAAGGHAAENSSDDYARWSAVTRAVLTHAGMPGEFGHPDSAQQRTGGDDDGWGEFLAAIVSWKGEASWTVRELTERMDDRAAGELTARARELVEALPPELHKTYARARESASAIRGSLSSWLRNRKGRWADGKAVQATRDKITNTSLWQVAIYTPRSQNSSRSTGGTGGTGGIPSHTEKKVGLNDLKKGYDHESTVCEGLGTPPAAPPPPVDLEGSVTMSDDAEGPILACRACGRSDHRTAHGLALCAGCATG